jgi:hypothetical protein
LSQDLPRFRPENLKHNRQREITPDEMAELESIASTGVVQGDRYEVFMLTYRNSDTPPLSSWKAI